jgi:signal transduction histidine kinase
MNLRALRWLTVAIPLAFLVLVDILRHQLWPEVLHPWPGFIVVLAVLFVAILGFSRAVFDRVEVLEGRIVRQNAELRKRGEMTARQTAQLETLYASGLALASDLSLEPVLRRIVELARELTGARYGALAVVDEQGGIARFLTDGLTPEERALLGEPPTGRGLLGRIFADCAPIRVDEIARDPRSVGFPPGHPPMRTFLGVPIVLHGRSYGNLYLTDKQGAAGPVPFTEDDERAVTLFAAQAAIAMENARLHGQVEASAAAVERDRIARELHDSLAQALGYIRMQAASARGNGATDQVVASTALARIDGVAAEAYGEVREAILGLRSGGSSRERTLPDALREYAQRFHEQSGVAVDVEIDAGVEAVRLGPAVEVQLVRIVQEALANVRKHARSERAVLRLALVTRAGGPRVRAEIIDAGRGFEIGERAGDGGPAHFGLEVMRERAESVGGSLTVTSAPARGTRVCAEVPVISTAVAVGEA